MKTILFEKRKIAPSKIVCIGRNYIEHIRELNNEIPSSMVIFNKPNSSISTTLHDISDDCHFEAEISFLIQDNKIKGVGFGLDLTKRDLQSKLKSKSLPWERAKAFDNSAVFGKFVSYSGNFNELSMKLFINDRLIQLAKYEMMIYKPNEILKEIQSFMSLYDGDIIMSGTPKGVGRYKKGDIFRGEIFQNDKLLIKSLFEVE